MARDSPFIAVENKIVGMARWLPGASVLFLLRSAESGLSVMIVLHSIKTDLYRVLFFTEIFVAMKEQHETELTEIKRQKSRRIINK